MPFLKERAKTYVVFSKTKRQTETWVRGKLWKKALSIPGVSVMLDGDGEEIKRFGAETSGQTMLYDENGTLVFSGGITPERGQMGDSAGRTAILTHLENPQTPASLSPVFGCFLTDPERAEKGATT